MTVCCLLASWTGHKFLKVTKSVIIEQFRHKDSILPGNQKFGEYEGVHTLVAVNHTAQEKMKHVHESDERNALCRKMFRGKNVQPKDGSKKRF